MDINAQYAYTPHIWPSVLTVLLLIALSIYSSSRRSVPGALPFLISCLFAMLMATGLLMTYLAVEPETKIFWFRFESSLYLPAASAVTCFILEYAWPGRWLTRRNLILLTIFPLAGIFYYFAAGNYFPTGTTFLVGESVTARFSPVSRIFIIYLFALMLVNLVVFAWLFIRSPRHRWPVILMAASQIAARAILLGEAPALEANILYIPIFALPFVAYAIALFGFRIFDPIPMARQTAIDQLNAGMLVLDPQGKVASLNPAAERILQVSASHARGQPIREMLPAYPDGSQTNPLGTEIEFDMGSETALRSYTLATSLLKDFRGLEVGRLLLLRDVTEQKRAQAQILEQQRVLATQNERERMARELHDSLGQVLSYTGFQVETAARLSRDGQVNAAAEQLDRLGGVVREAHADLREVILNLHSTTSLQQPFFTVVKQYLDAFTSSYAIQTFLSVGSGLGEAAIAPETQLQIFRIFQEALSNARKHGQAHQVRVTFVVEAGNLCMSIQDDGLGFDPDQVAKSSDTHYGLQFMQERAAQLAGNLQVQSTPGAGTHLRLVIPSREK